MLGSADFGDATVIADLEAGIGTLMRLGERQVDGVLVVAEPTPKSLEVGARAAAIAAQKSLGRVIVVANRVRDEDDRLAVEKAFPEREVVLIPDDPAIVAVDRDGLAPLDFAADSPSVQAIVELAKSLVPAARA